MLLFEFGEMDDKVRLEHSTAFGVSLRRMQEIIGNSPVSKETSAIMSEVMKMARGFNVLTFTCTEQLVRKIQEVKVLQKEKQVLENKLEQLACVVSSMVSGKTTVLKDASNVDLSTTIKSEEQIKNPVKVKDGHSRLSLHLKCEEELIRGELELAKLREAYTGCTFDLRNCRKEVFRMEIRLKKAETQAATKENERVELLKTRTDEITSLKMDIVRLKEEAIRMRKETGRLEEQLGKAALKNEQFVELLKKDSKQQDELRRQQKTLKGYLQLLASKFTSTQESEDLQFELRGLECRGLDDDTTSYLKTILERGVKPVKCSVGTQTISKDVSHRSSSTQTGHRTATAGTQTSSDYPSALHLVEPPLTEAIEVLDHPWNLNFVPDGGEGKGPQDLDDEYPEVIRFPQSTEEPRRENTRDKCLDHAGTKRPIEIIDLGSDSDDESEKRQDGSRQKYRQLSPWLERVGNALDVHFPLCRPSSPEAPNGRKEGRGVRLTGEEVGLKRAFGEAYS